MRSKSQFVLVACVLMALACVDTGSATESPVPKKYPQNKIEHVVVLMLENRSFDHMLGWLKQEKGFENVNGLKGTETNPMNCSDPKSPLITITKHADFEPGDLGHEVSDTTEQMTCDRPSDHSKVYKMSDYKMNGFITNAHHTSYGPEHAVKFPKQAMEAFPEAEVPVIWKLARTSGFADNYYCSVPGPTQNNRLFTACGSVSGLCVNFDRNKVLKGLPATTMYKKLQEQGVSWGVYMHDLSSLLYFKDFRSFNMVKNVHFIDKFHEQAAAGTLPAFSWLEPRYFDSLAWQANDQHPSHPVPYGETLIKQVYESLRKSPKWSKTAFVITYDEHGGFYDHVVPPLTAPDPETPTYGACTADGGGPRGFKYNRMGLRVPLIVVSPYTPARLFNSLDASQKPYPDSVLEHTSLWQTIKKLFGVQGDLSVRSKWAADFANWFSLATPRTDHPMTLPNAAPVRPNPNNQPNGLQHDFTILLSLLIGVPPPTGMVETKAGEFVVAAVAKAKEILANYEAAKQIVKTTVVAPVKAAGKAVVNGVTSSAQAVAQTTVNAAKATVAGIQSAYAWLTGSSFVELEAGHHAGDARVLLEQLHAAIEARNAQRIQHWHEVHAPHTRAPRHRSGRAGHNKHHNHLHDEQQAALQPERDPRAVRFAEADTDADAAAKALAEAKTAANMPIRSASGELIGPNANNALFDVDAYIANGPFFMPGVLSQEAELAGADPQLFDVFHDV